MVVRHSVCGESGGYNRHMEEGSEPCQPCRDARAAEMRKYRKWRILNHGEHLRIECSGSRRRLQALLAIGYSMRDLADSLGKNRVNVAEIVNHKQDTVHRDTAAKIIRLYDEVSMIPPEVTRERKAGMTWTRKKGFVPVLAWDDDLIDDPFAIPEGLTRTQAYTWFWGAATMTERIEWVLEHGLRATREESYWHKSKYR